MAEDKEFALLVGKAFLREIGSGNTESAIAFGRAFLLALGKRGPEPSDNGVEMSGRGHGESFVHAET